MAPVAQLSRIQVQPRHLEIVRAILREIVPDCRVWVFGSRARGTARPYSDLDLAVSCAGPIALEVSAALADAFCESDLPWRVDLVDWAAAGGGFRRIIERDRVLLQG